MKTKRAQVVNPYGYYPSDRAIRFGKERTGFAVRNMGKYDTTLAIYNNGRRLVMCPADMPADSYYEPVPWKWIRYQDFSDDQGFLIVSEKLFGGCLRDQVRFQTLGHGQNVRMTKDQNLTATIRVGSVWTANGYKIGRTFFIPPKFMQYIRVHLGHVKDSLLVYAPLPYQTFVHCPAVKRMSDQCLALK